MARLLTKINVKLRRTDTTRTGYTKYIFFRLDQYTLVAMANALR